MRLGAAWVWSGVTGCGRVRPGAGGCDWVRVEESFIRCPFGDHFLSFKVGRLKLCMQPRLVDFRNTKVSLVISGVKLVWPESCLA